MDETRIDTLTIEIGASSDKATQEIEKVSSAIKKLQNETRQWGYSNNRAIKIDADTLPAKSKIENIKQKTESLKEKTKLQIDDSDVNKASKSVNNLSKMWASLKRVAMYRLLRTAIKEVTQAMSEGLENAYEYSKVTGGELAPALDRIATASTKMKNQLGAAFGELLITIEPVITELIHLVTLLAEAFTWLIATLSGRSEFMLANEVATGWKEADRAAKDYKKTILGFDVINRLNGPGGGGDSGTTTKFEYKPTDVGKFEMPDLRTWWVPFIEGGNTAVGVLETIANKIKALGTLPLPDLRTWYEAIPGFEPVKDGLLDLKSLLESIFGKEYALNLGFQWNVEPVPVLEGFREAINSLVSKSPYVVELLWNLVSPIPEIETITNTISGLVDKQKLAFQTAYVAMSQTISDFVNDFGRSGDLVLSKAKAVREGIANNLTQTKAHIITFAKETLASWTDWAKQTAYASKVMFRNISDSVASHLDTARNNIVDFTSKTKQAFVAWAVNVAESAQAAFSNISQNVYLGLQNAADNIVSFVNGTASSIAQWAENGVKNFAAWANGVIDSVLSGLKTAWESFKSFMEATGQAISSWWNGNKQWVVPVAVGAAITVAAIALAPATGGASLAALAFANGGFPEDGMFFANHNELVGKFSNGRTAVANNEQIVGGIAEGVYNAVLAAMGNNDDRPVSVRVYLDSREIKTGQQRLARVTGG